jgi:polysaccharide deacetylase 2 family uncharacterized protein YibQ
MLWPHADHSASGGGHQQPVAAAAASRGGLAAVPASIAGTAKRQPSSAAVATHAGIERRLPQVANAMPEIGVPERSGPDRTATGHVAPAPEAAGSKPELSSGGDTASSAGAGPPVTAAALDLAPDDDRVGRLPEVVIQPAARPSADSGSAHDGTSGSGVAALDARAAILPPAAAEQGTPTWLRNAVALQIDSRPAIAVVIDDMGFNRRAGAAINQLRGPLTLAFLPSAAKLDEQTRAARAAGHELLVHVPMEPRGQAWPGPDALTSQLAPAELIGRLRAQLGSFRGFVGINNHMGSLLTTDPQRMGIVMAELRRLGLLFLDSRTTPQSIAAREAERIGVPNAVRDVFIDHDLDRASVLRALERAERIARQHGHAVVIGHPHDVTIEALRIWLPRLEARDIALAPVSAIVARRSCASGILLVADACARYAVAATAAERGMRAAPAVTARSPRT